jgi:hypothetical protein
MLNSDLFNLLNFISNKEQSGLAITIDDFNLSLQVNQTRFIDFLFSEYERTKKISATFQVLRTKLDPDLTIDSTGLTTDGAGHNTLPSDFLFVDSARYIDQVDSIDYSRVIDELDGDRYSVRMSSSIAYPTLEHPIMMQISNHIQFEPLRNTTVKFIYIRRPVTPYLDYAIDGTTYLMTLKAVGSGSTTVEMELRDEDKLHVLGMVLQEVGVNLKDESIQKYAQQYIQVTK